MVKEITQNKVGLWFQPDGKGTALDILAINRYGAGDKTIPRAGRDAVTSRDEYGNPIIKKYVKTPPGGLITFNLEWTKIASVEFLETVARCGTDFSIWEFFVDCGVINNLTKWGRLDYWGGLGVTQNVQGAGPARDGSGADVVNNVDVSGLYQIIWVPLELTAQTSGVDENLNDIAGLKDCADDCLQGYGGPDEILYAVTDYNAGSPGDPGDVIYTVNGGGTWATLGPPYPMAPNESLGDVEIMFISKTQYRVVIGRSTSTADEAEVAYGDFTLGAPATTTWTNVDVGTTGTEVIEALEWLWYNRFYAAAGGDIYISTDQAESWGTAVYTGATTINAFCKDADESVWAVGDSNLILRETGKSGTFETRTGPSGGGAFYSVAVANDGRLYAGNGNSIYISTNAALNTGGWTELHDFGAGRSVQAIHLGGQAEVVSGDSQLITAVVDNTGIAVLGGEVWRSWDGGDSWREVTELTNTGYNAAYFSDQDDNLAIIVGDDGTIHKAAPCASC